MIFTITKRIVIKHLELIYKCKRIYQTIIKGHKIDIITKIKIP